jgi:hypothetical protein
MANDWPTGWCSEIESKTTGRYAWNVPICSGAGAVATGNAQVLHGLQGTRNCLMNWFSFINGVMDLRG